MKKIFYLGKKFQMAVSLCAFELFTSRNMLFSEIVT